MAENEPSPEAAARRDMIATGMMGAAALAAISGFGVLFSLWWQTSISDPYEVLRIASQEFVAGRPVVAGELAQRVEFEEPSDILDELTQEELETENEEEDPAITAAKAEREEREEWIRLRDFLVGVGKYAKAEAEEEVRRRRQYLYEAIPYLERARDGGFPPGRHAQGYRVLGESYFQLGQYDGAIDSFKNAMLHDPTLRRPLQPKLAEAQLNSLAPITDQALATINEYLQDHTLLIQQRWAAELIRIRALIDLKRWEEANRIVNRELANPPSQDIDLGDEEAEYRDHLVLLQSIARIRRAIERYGPRPTDPYEDRSEAIAEIADVIPLLTDLQREATPKIGGLARLWAARALLVQGNTKDALTRLTLVRQQRPFDAVAVVGGLEEAELFSSQGRGEETLQTISYMMRELGDARGFDASMITFDEFQRRLATAIGQLRRNGEFEYAIDISRRLPPVIDVAEALIQEGISYREWAAATIADGTDIGGQVARSASILARARFRAAGDAFARAAELQFDTEEYLSTQWSAIDAYQKGRHFTHSIRLLEPYLRYERRGLQPRALVAYGRALLAEDRPKEAIDALTTCIVEYPRDPLRYDARLLAALAHAELGDLDAARVLLQDNLQDGSLTPQSPAWRDSLLTLGELLYQRAYRNFLMAEQAEPAEKLALLEQNQPILEEAIRHLDEAVERYFLQHPRAESAAYLSARANVMASHWPRIESELDDSIDQAKREKRKAADQALQTALDGFVALRKHLSNREEEQRLPDGEQAMLRNCFLAEADVLRQIAMNAGDKSKLEDAAAVYRAVELRYMNEPPALEALLGRARCARELGRPQEANLLIRQANVVLQRIPAEWNDRFLESTRFDREGWETFLGWMNDRLIAGDS